MDTSVLSTLKDGILDLAVSNAALIAPIAFLLGLAESIVVVSWFVPSSMLLVALGALQQLSGGSPWAPWLAAALGAFIGDAASYLVGWRQRTDVRRLWPFSQQPHWLLMARLFFRSWGAVGIVGSKFLGPLRAFVPIVAGASSMRPAIFLPASALSCLVWSGTFLLPGFGLTLLAR